MAKVYPQALASSNISSKKEVFTIWMKSLILNGNGCTVFDSDGQIVYRVDNYNKKCSDEVYLMDFRGKVLFTIRKKKLNLFGCWEGYKLSSATDCKKGKPEFRVRKAFGLKRRDSTCNIVVGLDRNQPHHYKMENWNPQSSCNIVDNLGGLVAEVKGKRSTSGVVLGDDVLTMVVQPHINHSIVMGLVVVFALINHKM